MLTFLKTKIVLRFKLDKDVKSVVRFHLSVLIIFHASLVATGVTQSKPAKMFSCLYNIETVISFRDST